MPWTFLTRTGGAEGAEVCDHLGGVGGGRDPRVDLEHPAIAADQDRHALREWQQWDRRADRAGERARAVAQQQEGQMVCGGEAAVGLG